MEGLSDTNSPPDTGQMDRSGETLRLCTAYRAGKNQLCCLGV